MKTYIVTQTQFHTDLLARLLETLDLPEHAVVRGGRPTSALSRGSGLVAKQGAPVIVVLDSDTVEPHAIAEKREIPEYLLRSGGYPRGARPAELLMAVPQVEAVLFGDAEALECVLGRPLTEREKIEGEFRPRAVVDRLLGEMGLDHDALLARITPRASACFAAHPLIQSLARFVREANASDLALADAA